MVYSENVNWRSGCCLFREPREDEKFFIELLRIRWTASRKLPVTKGDGRWASRIG
ncbi:hypothetical protein LMG29542_01193 [Paraburkholderia humisilvae]|uniref:Uncharacterized protein n=1 Tax=Paraburkholderia humisilvae TaxID=627669 RepID=A0A6J5DAF0_9BURK|nr:hypothetical protein LMG29542_01193 [Paraburkholderia humisilvae]